jgi:ABC-2 type transport system permease protein
VADVSKYLRLLAIQLRISLASAMAYRANFLIEGVLSAAWLALTLLPLIVLYGKRDAVNGWDLPSALVVMAYFTGLRAVLEGMISPSLVDLVERIRSGSFDYVLLKPIDAQAVVSASRYEPWKAFDLLGAIGIAIYAFWRRGTPPSPGDIALGLALFVAGAAAMYALWIVCAAASFWVGRLDNLMYLLGSIFDAGRWPVRVLPGIWRIIFTFVIPIAVMTTFPAMALLGTLDAPRALATIGGAIVMLIVSRLVWRSAIRSYTSASS